MKNTPNTRNTWGGEVFLPNVSYCAAQNEVHYNPLIPSEPKALKFTTEEPTAYLMIYGIGDNTSNLEYSTDGSSWTSPTYQAAPEDAGFEYVSFARFGKDTPIYLRGDNPNGLSEMTEMTEDLMKVVLLNVVNTNDMSSSDISSVEYACSGNVMHLLSYEEDLTAIPCVGCFYGLFALMSLPNLITSAPELPATSLTEYCYASMFYGCTSLTAAPELPATTLEYCCYTGMFDDCTSLNYIKVGALSWKDEYAYSWVGGVSQTGTFVIPSDEVAENFYYSEDCVPESWDIVYGQVTPPEPLKITVGNKTCLFCVGATVAYTGSYTEVPYIEYSHDREIWNTLEFVKGESENAYSARVEFTNTIYIRGNNPTLSYYLGSGSISSENRMVNMGVTNLEGTQYEEFACEGNIMSLLSYEFSKMAVPYTCFMGLFQDTLITKAPELPATKLTTYCYYCMFRDCTSLTTAPELPVTTLPETEGCYYGMFYGCTSLTTAPELPATTLDYSCYKYMFAGCTSLNYVKCLATDVSASNCLDSWMDGVASTGTFVKKAGVTYPSGVSGIPSGWTVEEV